MARDDRRDVYGYIPGFAVVVVVLLTVAFAPSLIPRPVREKLGLVPERLVAERHVPTSGSFAFLAHQDSDTRSPVGYDPCKEIKVRVNPRGAPEGFRSLVDEALAHVGAAAGLRLRDIGTTDERPRWDEGRVPVIFGEPRSRPVLIAWADEAEVPQLEGRIAGVGGSLAIEDRSGRARYLTGGVTLDTGVYARLMETEDGRAEARAILLHELGHLVGLDHVEDEDELMNGDNVGMLDYGPGDLAGLARVGATPCA